MPDLRQFCKFFCGAFLAGSSISVFALDVIFLPQTHAAPGKSFEALVAMPAHLPERFFSLDLVLESQLKIAKFLAQTPGATVFDEGLDFSYYEPTISPFKYLKNVFPNGLPSSPEDLNFQQKRALYEEGGASVAFSLGFVKSLRKTHPLLHSKDKAFTELRAKAEEMQLKMQWSDDSVNRYVFDERERMAIEELRNYAPLNADDRVILVYGAAHDFKKYESTLGHLKFSTPYEFDQRNQEMNDRCPALLRRPLIVGPISR